MLAPLLFLFFLLATQAAEYRTVRAGHYCHLQHPAATSVDFSSANVKTAQQCADRVAKEKEGKHSVCNDLFWMTDNKDGTFTCKCLDVGQLCNYNSQPHSTVYHLDTIHLTCRKHWWQFDNKCFAVFPAKDYWVEAEARCQGWGILDLQHNNRGDLAMIANPAENAFLQNLICYSNRQKKKADQLWWTGCHNVQRQQGWIWGNHEVPFNYANWREGWPNLENVFDDCCTMELDGQWVDRECFFEPDNFFPFVCQYELHKEACGSKSYYQCRASSECTWCKHHPWQGKDGTCTVNSECRAPLTRDNCSSRPYSKLAHVFNNTDGSPRTGEVLDKRRRRNLKSGSFQQKYEEVFRENL